MTREEIIDLYVETQDFHLVQRKSKMPPFRLHIVLAQAGVLQIQDKVTYGSRAQKLGGKAEELFQKLVPDAIDANRRFRKNNPVYDFVYKNLTIDVKYSSINKKKHEKVEFWAVRATGDQDVIVAFLEREKDTGIDNPYILFIPMSFIPEGHTKIHISRNGMYFKDFQVEAEELAPYIKEYAAMKGEWVG